MTSIKEIGGEFALLERLLDGDDVPGELVKGVGDDCAVINVPGRPDLLLVTTDMLVDGDHFSRDWYTPKQIGRKCMEANISDIAAMGGLPDWIFISLALTNDISVEFMEGLYTGFKDGAQEHGAVIAGGDTTHGNTFVVNITVLGHVEREHLCLRGDARVGDGIYLSGDVGKSWAGLELLRQGKTGYTQYHLNPRCRLGFGRKIAPMANAMIDVSDGLASEVRHICRQSGVGAVVYKGNIPMNEGTVGTGKELGIDPLKWALSGGEDFELVFTTSPENEKELLKLGAIQVGEVLKNEEGIWLEREDGERLVLEGGYDHFR